MRQGSLAAAARVLGVTPPALTLRLQKLEERAGVRLFDRNTRRATLTSEGELILMGAQAILARIDALADGLRERGGHVAGELKVVAPFGFGWRHAVPFLAEFQERNAQLRVTLSLSERPAREALEGFDLALHIGLLKDSSLLAYRLAENVRLACASPAYLRRAGKPRPPADLRVHACLVIRENDEHVTVSTFKSRRETKSIRVQPSLVSNDGEVVHDWALAGRSVAIRSE